MSGDIRQNRGIDHESGGFCGRIMAGDAVLTEEGRTRCGCPHCRPLPLRLSGGHYHNQNNEGDALGVHDFGFQLLLEYTTQPARHPMKKRLIIASLLILAATSLVAAPVDLRLVEAVKKQDVKAVRTLIAAHVSVNAADVDGSTALHWAAQRDN